MLDRIKLFFKEIFVGLTQRDSFIQNLGIVFSGKTIIFLIGFGLTPVISRIYTPEAYGTFAIFNVVVLNLGLIATLRLPLAIVVAKEEEDFRDLLTASVTTSLFVAVLASGILALAGKYIFSFFNQPILGNYWPLIGLSILIYSLCRILGNWNIREKVFRKSSVVAISETIATKSATLIIGILTHGFGLGLVFGELIGKTSNLLMQELLFIKNRFNWLKPSSSFKRIKRTIYKFRNYPLYIFPSNWVSLLSDQAVVLLIASRFGSDLVGSYSMAYGLLMVPINLLSNSVQPVLMQRISEKLNRGEAISSIIAKTSNKLLYITILPFAFLFTWGDLAIRIFLGDNWVTASIIISYLSLLGILKLQSEALSGVLIALERQKEILYLNLAKLALISIFLGASFLWHDNFYAMLLLFIIGAALASVLWIGYVYKFAKVKTLTFLIGPSIFLVLVCVVFYLVRIIIGL